MVLFVRELVVSRSLKKRLRKRDYRVTADRAFSDVLRGCSAPRAHERGTWIVPAMTRAYEKLRAEGLAHSIEVWMNGSRESAVGSRESAVGSGESAAGSHEELVGGLYGVALGRMFFGESMFSHRSDASKIALVHLVAQFERWGFPLIDCQMSTSHLASLGARDLSRREFTRTIAPLVVSPSVSGPWVLDEDLLG